MKRIDLIQLTVMIIGLFSGFQFIAAAPQLLLLLVGWFIDGLKGGEYMAFALSSLLLETCYFFTALLCLKQSKYVAEKIAGAGGFDQEINIALDKHNLLEVLFIGMGIYGIINKLFTLIVNVFDRIATSNRSGVLNGEAIISNKKIAMDLLVILAYFVLVYYARTLADFFARKINNIEPEPIESLNEEE